MGKAISEKSKQPREVKARKADSSGHGIDQRIQETYQNVDDMLRTVGQSIQKVRMLMPLPNGTVLLVQEI